jgi:cytochrome c-type biogenesis protein CcsB
MKELIAGVTTGLFSGSLEPTSLALFHLTVLFYLVATVAYLAHLATRKDRVWRIAFTAAACGWLLETAALILRWIAAGWDHPPFTNMYESLVFFAWGIVVTYLVIEWIYKIRIAGAFVIPFAFAAMGLASLNPDKSVTPLVPALQSIWLHLHVVTASIGYAAFLVAFGISVLFLIKDRVDMGKAFAACSVANVAGLLAVTNGGALFGKFQLSAVRIVNGVVEKAYIPGTNPPEFEVVNVALLGGFSLVAIIVYTAAAFLSLNSVSSTDGKASSAGSKVFFGATALFVALLVYFIIESVTNPLIAIRANPYSFALLGFLCLFSALAVIVNRSHKAILEVLPEAKKLDEMAYRAIMVAFPIMTLIIITGAVWANSAWGRYWGWDPKETASLFTWIIYLLYLHTRITKGWTGRRTALISIIGFVSVLFTYLGVNLLLSGLHAYATG